MKDKSVATIFQGDQGRYMMEAERRLSTSQDSITSQAASIAANTSSIAALTAVVAALAINYAFGSISSSATTTSTAFVDLGALACTITTTGGDLLVILAGGSIANDSFQRDAYFAVQVNGSDYLVSDYYQDIASDADDVQVPIGGLYVITGLAAGTYTVKGRFRTTAGGTARFSGNGRLSLFAMEMTL